MKRNVGQLSTMWFVVSAVLCLTIGIAIYRRFSFVQNIPQDATKATMNDLERKISDTQQKVDRQVSDVERKNADAEKKVDEMQKKLDRVQIESEHGTTKRDAKKPE